MRVDDVLGAGVHNILSDLTKRLVSVSDILPNGNYEVQGELMEGWLCSSSHKYDDLCEQDRELNRQIVEKYFGDLLMGSGGA